MPRERVDILPNFLSIIFTLRMMMVERSHIFLTHTLLFLERAIDYDWELHESGGGKRCY